MHSLIEMGKSALPHIVEAWGGERDIAVRNRLFEVLSEMPCEESVPMFEQKLSSPDQDEVRFATLGLFSFDPLRFEKQILNAVEMHPALSAEVQFVDYIRAGFERARQRLDK